MIRYLAIAFFFLMIAACGGDPTPLPQPTPTPTAELSSTPEATATPAPPTMTPEPTSTPVLEPTSTPLPPTATIVQPTAQAEYRSSLGDQFAEIMEKMESVEPLWTVYFHSDDWQTPGTNTTISDIFELLKLENIVSHDGYQRIDPETVVAREPDIIIADSLDSILENPDLSGLHMVQDPEHVPHHIFVLSQGHSFDPDDHHFKDAVEEFAAFVYPEVFGQHESRVTGGMEHTDADDAEKEENGHDHDNGHSH